MNRFFRNKYFPIAAQLLMLAVFVLLLVNALGIGNLSDEMDYLKILRNTNLSNLTVWAYWWPLIILTALLLGRWWCTICPVELINSVFSFIGFKKKPGRFLKSGWLITIFYLIILAVGIEVFKIHRIPDLMAFYLISLAVIAVFAGIIFEKRTFCNHICPVGHLLGLYSILSPFRLKATDKSICKECKTKDCYNSAKYNKLNARSCTSNLNPSAKTNTVQCINCTQCMSACPYNNLSFKKVRLKDRLSNLKLNTAQAAFLLIISSFIIAELLSDLEFIERFRNFIPESLSNILNISLFTDNLFIGISNYIIYPFIFVLIIWMINRFFTKTNFKNSLKYTALFLLPALAILHALKGLTKMVSRLPWLSSGFNDIKGVDSADLIYSGKTSVDTGFADSILNILFLLSPVVILFAGFLMFKIFKLQTDKKSSIIPFIFSLAYIIFFGFSLFLLS